MHFTTRLIQNWHVSIHKSRTELMKEHVPSYNYVFSVVFGQLSVAQSHGMYQVLNTEYCRPLRGVILLT